MSNRIAIPIQYIKKLRLIHGLLVKMEVYIDILCLLAQPKEDNTKYKNKKQPELPENQTVWKSDNQGVKEETSSRLVGGAERTHSKVAAGGPRGPTFMCR